MSIKLSKNRFPSSHICEDFKCFGPIAVTDGQFDSCLIADLGCFTVVKNHKISLTYYLERLLTC